MSGFGCHSAIADAVHTALFDRNNSLGPMYAEYFDPIPLSVIALIFTAVCCALFRLLVANARIIDLSLLTTAPPRQREAVECQWEQEERHHTVHFRFLRVSLQISPASP